MKKLPFISLVFLIITLLAPLSYAADEEILYLVISATGYETRKDLMASNITVVTKEEISRLPAHDVSEALGYVSGLTLDRGGGPGQTAAPSIYGSNYRHIKIMVDGIPLETMSEGFPDLSLIQMENVERIEIMKGSASSIWGASLGGLINIITVRPAESITADGGISFGEYGTSRVHASLSGTSGAGYYISANKFDTDGLRRYQKADNGNFYAKVTKAISPAIDVEGSYDYTEINRQDSGWVATEETFDRRAQLALTYSPYKSLDLTVNGYSRTLDSKYTDIATDWEFGTDKEKIYGGGLRSVWRHSKNGTLSVGAEGSKGDLKVDFGAPVAHDTDKSAVSANETLLSDKFSLNLGIRHDYDSTFGSETSPSAGVVYQAGPGTLFRISAARGFTPPPTTYRYLGLQPNHDLTAERAWTYQAGVETRLIPWFWWNINLYRVDITDAVTRVNDTADIDSDGDMTAVLMMKNVKDMRRQGYEIEARTDEYSGFSLTYSYNFNDVRDMELRETVKGQARVTQNIGVDYRGPYDTRTTLRGHYSWWNADPSYNAKDKNIIWDLKVTKYLAGWRSAMGEMFVAVHNISDEEQFWTDIYPNPGRWVEAGINLTTF